MYFKSNVPALKIHNTDPPEENLVAGDSVNIHSFFDMILEIH